MGDERDKLDEENQQLNVLNQKVITWFYREDNKNKSIMHDLTTQTDSLDERVKVNSYTQKSIKAKAQDRWLETLAAILLGVGVLVIIINIG